jgi:hypothetical protein
MVDIKSIMEDIHTRKIEDNRNREQVEHTEFYVVAHDVFLSGWGLALNGKSYVAWACDNYHGALTARDELRKRPEMKKIRIEKCINGLIGRMTKYDHLHIAWKGSHFFQIRKDKP